MTPLDLYRLGSFTIGYFLISKVILRWNILLSMLNISWLVESAILKCFFVRKREFHSAKFKWLPSGYLYMQGNLFECGDIHPHPGPLTCKSAVRHDSSRRKCKECDRTIASNHRATRCDCDVSRQRRQKSISSEKPILWSLRINKQN